ncbi:MAG TPA: hypothetical protein VFN41_05810, partial [Candidatus Limnocylindrales bacterium]|nr:hypothetical protein [Candidatus Limnocylindrales bacterium]
MPRSGWIAIGATIASLAVVSGDRRLLALVVAGLAAALVVSALTARRRTAVLALAIGVAVIVVRGVSAPVASELAGTPTEGPWTMVVESVGSPRDGQQVATLRTLDEGSTGFRLAATLPRYPQVEPGDRLEVDGRVRVRPDGPYGEYLAKISAWGTLDARKLA